jgi:hypothetical protein
MTHEQVAAEGFHKAGTIERNTDSGKLLFNLSGEFEGMGTNANTSGWVYLWVKVNGDHFDICYVGKAGRTLRCRCAQHVGGFNGGSVTGRKHARRIRDFLNIDKGNKMHVFARESDRKNIFNVENISMCDVEEIAMIMKLERLGVKLWNKAKRSAG